MTDDESMFQAYLEKAEKMTEAELHEHLRQYVSLPLPYRAYYFELVRRGGQKLDKAARKASLFIKITLGIYLAFMIFIWLAVKKLIL